LADWLRLAAPVRMQLRICSTFGGTGYVYTAGRRLRIMLFSIFHVVEKNEKESLDSAHNVHNNLCSKVMQSFSRLIIYLLITIVHDLLGLQRRAGVRLSLDDLWWIDRVGGSPC